MKKYSLNLKNKKVLQKAVSLVLSIAVMFSAFGGITASAASRFPEPNGGTSNRMGTFYWTLTPENNGQQMYDKIRSEIHKAKGVPGDLKQYTFISKEDAATTLFDENLACSWQDDCRGASFAEGNYYVYIFFYGKNVSYYVRHEYVVNISHGYPVDISVSGANGQVNIGGSSYSSGTYNVQPGDGLSFTVSSVADYTPTVTFDGQTITASGGTYTLSANTIKTATDRTIKVSYAMTNSSTVTLEQSSTATITINGNSAATQTLGKSGKYTLKAQAKGKNILTGFYLDGNAFLVSEGAEMVINNWQPTADSHTITVKTEPLSIKVYDGRTVHIRDDMDAKTRAKAVFNAIYDTSSRVQLNADDIIVNHGSSMLIPGVFLNIDVAGNMLRYGIWDIMDMVTDYTHLLGDENRETVYIEQLNSSYETYTSAQVDVNIRKISITAKTDLEKAYDGVPFEISTAVTDNSQLQWQNTVGDVTKVEAAGHYDSSKAELADAPTAVGDYYLKVKVSDSLGSNTSDFIPYSIRPISTVTATPTANQLTYDGTAHALVTGGTADGGTLVYSLSENGQYSETIPTGTDAGEYTVWYYVQGDNDHADSAKDFVKVTVAKADQQIEIKDIPATVTYGDAFKLSAQLGEGSMDTSWSIESGADNATIDGNGNVTVTGAGDFTVTLTSHGKQNYSDKTVSHTFTAQKKQLTVAEVIAEDKFYNGKTDATIEEITLRGILNEDSVVALGTAQFADKNAGVAKPVTITGLTLKGSGAENYTLDVTTFETTADIIPALLKVAPKAGQAKAYGTADGEFAYEITAGKLYGDDKLTGALGREEGETVGEYAYTIGTLANPDYNIAFEADDKFEIVKGTPEYTAPTGLSATYGDTLANVKLPEGWAWKDEPTTSVGNIGEHKFTAIFTHADTANYNPVEAELTVKVNAKPSEQPAHSHSWSGLKNDSTSHYYECACGAKDKVTAHTYNISGRCTVCKYYNANAVIKPAPTPTTTPVPTAEPTEEPVEMPEEADTTITQAKPTEEAVEAAKDNVTVSEGTAQLNKEAVEAVADTQSEEKEIVLPLVQTTENVVNEAEIDTEALAEIAKEGKDVVIQFTDATVKLEAKAVKALTEQAKGKTIEIRAVIVEAHTLNEHQQEELKDTDHAVIISVQVFSDGEYIGKFRGGKATVMLPFQLDPGTKAEEYRVYYIDEKGDLHKVASEYIDGHMVFTTVHFSEYIIAHEAAQNGDTNVVTPQQPEQETSFPVLPVIMAIAAVVIILLIFKRKREDEE